MVIILVLLEDTLRAYETAMLDKEIKIVIILVLLEDTLRGLDYRN